MRRLTESVIGILLLAITVVLAAGGLITDLIDQSDPPTWYTAGAIAAIAAIAVAIDEHHRSPMALKDGREPLFGRALLAIGILFGAVGFALGLQQDAYHNLWLISGLIVELVGLTVIIDVRRLVFARSGGIPTRNLTDAIAGAIAAALAVGFDGVGVVLGLANDPHSPAWLYGGVMLALISIALMFDEQVHVTSMRVKKK